MKNIRYKDNSSRKNDSKGSFERRNNKPSRKMTGGFNPNSYINEATQNEADDYISIRKIEELPVDKQIIANLLKKGYKIPTEIQDKSIESILEGQNLMGIAQTGSGKTGAFLIPLMHNLIGQNPSFQVLVVAPTRELAVQTNEEFQSMSLGMRLFSTCLIGGTSVRHDVQNLRRPSHFVIGTPGRLLDMVRQRALDLKKFNVLVLDEFDRLLDMGFLGDIRLMVDGMANRQQTILFSATEEKGQKKIIEEIVENPVAARMNNLNATPSTVQQDIVRVKDGEKKMDVLIGMMRSESFDKVLVFAETKRWVSRICKDLRQSGITVDEIHGNKSQTYRLKALNSFKKEKIQVLVATDVAARGLDISHVSHVINYQQPRNMESYIHRIGRTGRAGRTGKAITFIN